VYAVATGWPQPQFAATGQLSYALQAMASLAGKGPPHLPLIVIGSAFTAVLCGLAAGHFAAARIPATLARRAAIVLAALATVVTVASGLHL
jgi:uncharacterized protein